MLTEGCFNGRTGQATRNELIWGSYFLFEALLVLTGLLDPLASLASGFKVEAKVNGSLFRTKFEFALNGLNGLASEIPGALY
jgi:hypothetical protein